MRWQDLPTSSNIAAGPDDGPSPLADTMIHLGPRGSGLSGWYYDYLRQKHLEANPPTQAQSDWTGSNMPAQLPMGPLADPAAAPDASIAARVKAAPMPFDWLAPSTWWGQAPRGTTLNTTAQ